MPGDGCVALSSRHRVGAVSGSRVVQQNTAVVRDLFQDGEVGRFFRGNLHCHSNRSDGLLQPDEVVGAYRDAGYDFICLSDHFEAEYGWHIPTRVPCATSISPP
jgi:hypothetical protein